MAEEDPYGVDVFKKGTQYRINSNDYNPFAMFERLKNKENEYRERRTGLIEAAAKARAAQQAQQANTGGGAIPGYSGGAGMVLNGPWGHPDEPGFAQKYLTSIKLPDGRNLTVHKNMAPAFSALFRDLWNSGYRWSDVGSYANRNINGRTGPGSKKSLHAWGAAVDIDPARNPFKGKGYTGALPTNVGWGAEKYGLYWGARFGDSMHFSPKQGPVPWH